MLSTNDTEVGDRIVATTSGHNPGSPVTLYLDGNFLTQGPADANGTFSSPLTVPAGPTFAVCATSPLCEPVCTDPGRVRSAGREVLGVGVGGGGSGGGVSVLGVTFGGQSTRGFARTGVNAGLLALLGVLMILIGHRLQRRSRSRRGRRTGATVL